MNKLTHYVTALLTTGILLLLTAGATAGGGPGHHAPDEVVCKMEPGYSIDSVNSLFGTSVKGHMSRTDCWLLNIPGGQNAESLAVAISKSPMVAYCGANYYLAAPEGLQRSSAFVDQQMAGDFEEQPASATLQLPTVHTLATGSGVRVGLIDGGVNFDHPEFAQYSGQLVSRWDYIDGDSLAVDEPGGSCSGHGTLVAGIIRLMAADADIYVYRVLDTAGQGDGYSIAEAVLQAAEDSCSVINLSLGMVGMHPALDDALKLLRHGPITVVASAGNDSTDLGVVFPFPASRTYCQTVAALDSTNQKADFSNYGLKVNVCAPGTWIYGPFLDTSYAWWDGTSFAAPFVSGMAALLYSARPGLTRAQADSAICQSATNVDSINPGFEGLLGAGLIDPVAAVNMVQSGVNGDANGDGVIDISDLVHLVDYMFLGSGTLGAWADGDGNDEIDITDLILLVEFIFAGL